MDKLALPRRVSPPVPSPRPINSYPVPNEIKNLSWGEFLDVYAAEPSDSRDPYMPSNLVFIRRSSEDLFLCLGLSGVDCLLRLEYDPSKETVANFWQKAMKSLISQSAFPSYKSVNDVLSLTPCQVQSFDCDAGAAAAPAAPAPAPTSASVFSPDDVSGFDFSSDDEDDEGFTPDAFQELTPVYVLNEQCYTSASDFLKAYERASGDDGTTLMLKLPGSNKMTFNPQEYVEAVDFDVQIKNLERAQACLDMYVCDADTKRVEGMDPKAVLIRKSNKGEGRIVFEVHGQAVPFLLHYNPAEDTLRSLWLDLTNNLKSKGVTDIEDYYPLKRPSMKLKGIEDPSHLSEDLPMGPNSTTEPYSRDLYEYFTSPLDESIFKRKNGAVLPQLRTKLSDQGRNLSKASALLGNFVEYSGLSDLAKLQIDFLKKSPATQAALFKSRVKHIAYQGVRYDDVSFHKVKSSALMRPEEMNGYEVIETFHATDLIAGLNILINGIKFGHRNAFAHHKMDNTFYTSKLLSDTIFTNYGISTDKSLGAFVIAFRVYSPEGSGLYVAKSEIGSGMVCGYDVFGEDAILVPYAVMHTTEQDDSYSREYIERIISRINTGQSLSQMGFRDGFMISYIAGLDQKLHRTPTTRHLLQIFKDLDGHLGHFLTRCTKLKDYNALKPGLLQAYETLRPSLSLDERTLIHRYFPEYNVD